jgi:flavin-dependent thymidylate synthase
MDVWRQWIRHRTANVNEYSTADSIANSAQTTAATEWRVQPSKQGTGAFLPLAEGQLLSATESQLQKTSREVYEQRIAAGVVKEQARKDLPLSTYTEAYWKIDLHNLLHFLQVRMHDHAQYEIRSYAKLIGYEIVAKWVRWHGRHFLSTAEMRLSYQQPRNRSSAHSFRILPSAQRQLLNPPVCSPSIRMARSIAVLSGQSSSPSCFL